MSTGLQTFDFAPGLPLRSITRDGVPWFVALDICDALGIRTDNAIRNLDDDEKANTAIEGFARGAVIVNESGLYSLVLRSRKVAAKAFRKWVTSAVLPTLRREGVYVSGEEQALPKCITEGELLARLETIQGRLDAIKAQKLAEFRAQQRVDHLEDRYTAHRALRTLRCKGRVTLKGWDVSLPRKR